MAQSKKINFNGQNIYIGIDVHLKSWSVTIMTDRVIRGHILRNLRQKSSLNI